MSQVDRRKEILQFGFMCGAIGEADWRQEDFGGVLVVELESENGHIPRQQLIGEASRAGEGRICLDRGQGFVRVGVVAERILREHKRPEVGAERGVQASGACRSVTLWPASSPIATMNLDSS
jgi:hypothetical protein